MTDELTKLITGISDTGDLIPVQKLKVHEDGGHHLAVSVFLYSECGLLLQQRAAGKYHSGGLWANSCCSHPDWQEDIDHCAHRRCAEELNLEVDLQRLGWVDYRADVGGGLIEHERAHIFVGQVNSDAINVPPNPDEVASTRWADRVQLATELTANPEKFSAWFQQYMARNDDALVAVRNHIWTLLEL